MRCDYDDIELGQKSRVSDTDQEHAAKCVNLRKLIIAGGLDMHSIS